MLLLMLLSILNKLYLKLDITEANKHSHTTTNTTICKQEKTEVNMAGSSDLITALYTYVVSFKMTPMASSEPAMTPKSSLLNEWIKRILRYHFLSFKLPHFLPSFLIFSSYQCHHCKQFKRLSFVINEKNTQFK